MKEELLKFCQEKSILLDMFLLDFFVETENLEKSRMFIEKIKNISQKRFLTKDVVIGNENIFDQFLKEISLNDKNKYNLLKSKLNINEKKDVNISSGKNKSKVMIKSNFVRPGKQMNPEDFLEYFKGRYEEVSEILQNEYDLGNLTSISKIDQGNRGSVIIGIVNDKSITKNGNVILDIEDFSGSIKVLIKSDKVELMKEAEDICLDSILAFRGSSNGEVLFPDKIYYPEAKLPNKRYSDKEEYALFIGDLHFGSKKFMKKSFDNFISYLKGEHLDTPEVDKIKYLFIVGDIVTGVGNYPNQENDLEYSTLEEQFREFANKIKEIREDISIIVSPGNHDCVRIMEPQPLINEKYAEELYKLKNVISTENPAYIKIGETDTFQGLTVLTYHGFSYPYYANNVPSLVKVKAMNDPTKIMKYLLKNRHLAPSHGSNQYFPLRKDPLLIRQIPDIFVSGHTHKCDVTYKDNILVISIATWEGMTDYQVKLGNEPDHAKVPIVNLKTRAVKIMDFEVEEDNVRVFRRDEK